MITLSRQEVKITPNGEVRWNEQDVAGGRLFAAESRENDDPLELLRTAYEDWNTLPLLGESQEGVVRQVGGYAVKYFKRGSKYNASAGRLPDLRANVNLAEGLKNVPQINDSAFRIRGVDIYASFEPHGPRKMGNEVLWLMEKVDGEHNPIKYGGLFPTRPEREAICNQALRNVGIHPEYVNLDESTYNMNNYILTTPPRDFERGELVKIDVRAEPGELIY